jgi:hypothetical protein
MQRAIAASVVESMSLLESSRPLDIHVPPEGEGATFYRALAGRTTITTPRLKLKDANQII